VNWLSTLLREHYEDWILGEGQILSFKPVVIHLPPAKPLDVPVITRNRR
jgi:hypothetical protein